MMMMIMLMKVPMMVLYVCYYFVTCSFTAAWVDNMCVTKPGNDEGSFAGI